MKGCAPSLAFIARHKATRKWLIGLSRFKDTVGIMKIIHFNSISVLALLVFISRFSWMRSFILVRSVWDCFRHHARKNCLWSVFMGVHV